MVVVIVVVVVLVTSFYMLCLRHLHETNYSHCILSTFYFGVHCRIRPNFLYVGRAIAQAVSRWLPTAAARVRVRVRAYGICGEQSGTGAGFLRVLRFPLPIFIPLTAPQSPSSGAGTIGQTVAAVPSGLSLTPIIIIIIINFLYVV
jgi:hypothetical protein